ncbi:hypothetical protein Pcinc_029025 [Petrolisthes cinctipes]|uniref:ILEI/PANDER domain-containing protein n=1 Tax=Petrolisthes cinctipes TaxID=88211 RepID=A0AAE1F1R7_PETCI|nr:hypothetical protein Pcinc_029025 [Petrolisthes cinctipes]
MTSKLWIIELDTNVILTVTLLFFYCWNCGSAAKSNSTIVRDFDHLVFSSFPSSVGVSEESKGYEKGELKKEEIIGERGRDWEDSGRGEKIRVIGEKDTTKGKNTGEGQEKGDNVGVRGTEETERSDKSRPKNVAITVLSSRRQVLVTVDGTEVVNVEDRPGSNRDEMDTARLYFVILNQFDGQVIMQKQFDFHNYAADLRAPPLLTALSHGRILIFCVKTEASLNMGQEVRHLLQQLGSTRAHRLPYRGYLAWVLASWGPSWGEATAGHPDDEVTEDEYWTQDKQDRNNTEHIWEDGKNTTGDKNDWQENRLKSNNSQDKELDVEEDGGRILKEKRKEEEKIGRMEKNRKGEKEKERSRLETIQERRDNRGKQNNEQWNHTETVPVELEVEDKLRYYEFTSPIYLEVVIPLVSRGKLLHHWYCWDEKLERKETELEEERSWQKIQDFREVAMFKEGKDAEGIKESMSWIEESMYEEEKDVNESKRDEEVEMERQRVSFCHQYEGYGALCDCHQPAPLIYPQLELKNEVIGEVPVLIIASSRPQALYRCLLTILKQEGGKRDRILVVIDGYNTEIVSLLHLLKINYLINNMEGIEFVSSGARISHHYRYALHSVFLAFPQASRAIVLEEDLLVAPDFFSYFNQTSWLLDVDPSLYCISAWNDLGALHSAHHPYSLRRVETHSGYGWMITRPLFEEIYDQWPSPNEKHDWDVWLRSSAVRGSRECVVPDVSRTFHYGVSGEHIQGVLTHAHFTAHVITATPAIRLQNVHRMMQSEYEEDLHKTLEGDNVYFLNSTKHPCTRNYIPRNFTDGPVVVFISMTGSDNHLGWKKMGACLGVWNLDQRSHHHGLFSLNLYTTKLYIIGYPFSDYSYLKPWWVHVVRESRLGREELLLGRRTLINRVRFPLPSLQHLAPHLLTEPVTPDPLDQGHFEAVF